MNFKSEFAFVRILFPFSIGIGNAYWLKNKDLIVPCFGLTLLLFSCLWLINHFYNRLGAYKLKGIIGLINHLAWYFLGAMICLANCQDLDQNYFGNKNLRYLKVWVNTEPQLKNGILSFELTVSSGISQSKTIGATGKLMVALKVNTVQPIQVNYGDQYLMDGSYREIPPPYNPGEFDFKSWLAAKNIYHQVFINQNQLVKLPGNNGNPILKYAMAARKRQVATYRRLIQNDEAFAVASTLVLGYRADLNKETLSAYSKTGTIHALSVSGMHVGIIYIFLNWALFFLDRNKILKIGKLLLICTLIWYYALLTGFSPSVLRAVVMLTVYILAKGFHRNSNSYNILAFTAFCLLAYHPLLLWDVGFQLSFIAVLGLVALQPSIYSWIPIGNKWLAQLWSTVALGLGAQFATFPLSIYYFHQFPLYFIFSNLFILLPLSAMMYLGIGILLLPIDFLAPMFEWIISFTNDGLKWIAKLPFAGISSIWITRYQLVLLTLTLICLVISFIRYQKRLLLCSIALLVYYQAYALFHKLDLLRQQKILFFSLKKHYAAAFIEANTATIITDLSEKDKNFDFFIQPALAQLQVTSISVVTLKMDTVIGKLIKNGNQIHYLNFHILLLDQNFNHKEIVNLPRFDLVWVHQNPDKTLLNLRKEVIFPFMIMDASNTDYTIDRLVKQANKIAMPHHTLKKNTSYLIELN